MSAEQMTQSKFGFEVGAKARVDELSYAVIGETPVDIDWAEALDENGEGWVAHECCECDECGEDVLTSGCGGEDEHSSFDYESECDGYLCPSGPMMNYYYPLYGQHDAEDALKLNGPVCLIEFADGRWALALTGGGMDLSWDICRAYIDLGYLPPVHFSDLPDHAGDKWTVDKAEVVYALRRAVDGAERQLAAKKRQLERAEEWLKKAVE